MCIDILYMEKQGEKVYYTHVKAPFGWYSAAKEWKLSLRKE